MEHCVCCGKNAERSVNLFVRVYDGHRIPKAHFVGSCVFVCERHLADLAVLVSEVRKIEPLKLPPVAD
jgi:hypothetical protein